VQNNSHTNIILVDSHDNEVGQMEKMEAHQKGLLHRAFSILVFNSAKELLLQRRALDKYHSQGLWTNTCCSHPVSGESNLEAAHRRLKEEMGFDCELKETFQFIYRTDLENNLVEHELDHVIVGHSDEEPTLNTNEAIAYKWMKLESILEDMNEQPEKYTFWFRIIIQEHLDQLKQHIQ